MLPHFLRGIATAAMYYFVLTGHRNVPLNDAQSIFLITASVLTNMTGCFVFIRAVRRIRSGVLVVIAYSVCAAGMLTVPWVRTVGAFFALYIIYMIALVITQYSIPYGVLRSTKNEDLALISARVCLSIMSQPHCLFSFWHHHEPRFPLVMACGAAAGLAARVLYMAQFHDELR